VGYEMFTHCRLYCGDREKKYIHVGHELKKSFAMHDL